MDSFPSDILGYWSKYSSTWQPKEKEHYLLLFLEEFTARCVTFDCAALRASFGDTTGIARELMGMFVSEVAFLATATQSPTVDLYKYLSGAPSRSGGALYLGSADGLSINIALEILSRDSANVALVPGFATVVAVVLSELFRLIEDPTGVLLTLPVMSRSLLFSLASSLKPTASFFSLQNTPPWLLSILQSQQIASPFPSNASSLQSSSMSDVISNNSSNSNSSGRRPRAGTFTSSTGSIPSSGLRNSMAASRDPSNLSQGMRMTSTSMLTDARAVHASVCARLLQLLENLCTHTFLENQFLEVIMSVTNKNMHSSASRPHHPLSELIQSDKLLPLLRIFSVGTPASANNSDAISSTPPQFSERTRKNSDSILSTSPVLNSSSIPPSSAASVIHHSSPHVLSIQRQLIRLLCAFMNTACSTSYFLAMVEKKYMQHLLSRLKQSVPLSSTLRVELCQLVIMSVMRSTNLSMSLFDEFEAQGGYALSEMNLLAVSEHGSSEEKLALLGALYHLCTFRSLKLNSTILAVDQKLLDTCVIRNLNIVNTLLNVFSATVSSELKTYVLRTLAPLISHDDKVYQVLKVLRPFKVFFQQFDFLDVSDRTLMLSVLAVVLRRGPILEEEVKQYCKLLQVSTSSRKPSSLLMVSKQLTYLIESNQISKSHLREAQLLSLLTEGLCSPKDLPCTPLLSSDPTELRLCLSLLKNRRPSSLTYPTMNPLSMFASDSVGSGLGTDDVTMTSSASSSRMESISSSTSSSIASSVSREGNLSYSLALSTSMLFDSVVSLTDQQEVLYGISTRLLHLLFVYLYHCKEPFIDVNGLKRLEALLSDQLMRQPALKVISIIAYDPQLAYRAIPDLITVLETSGGTATLVKEVLAMRKDILAALCYIFVNNPVAKEAFRLKGGFVWTVSILDGIGKCMLAQNNQHQHERDNSPSLSSASDASASIRVDSSEEYERTFHFVCVLLKTLSIALKRNAQNIEYFRREIQGFSTLSECLRRTRFLEYPQKALVLVDSLLDLASRGTWPPACPKHPLSANPPEGYAQGNPQMAQPTNRLDIHTCNICKDCAVIELPEIFCLIVEAMGRGITEKQIDRKVVRLTLEQLTFFIDFFANLQRLCAINFVSCLIDNFTSTLLNAQDGLHQTALRLIEKVASHSMTLEELRKYMALMRTPQYPIELLKALTRFSTRNSSAPLHHVDFPGDRSRFDSPDLGDRLWPPQRGYAISFWFQVSCFKEPSTDNRFPLFRLRNVSSAAAASAFSSQLLTSSSTAAGILSASSSVLTSASATTASTINTTAGLASSSSTVSLPNISSYLTVAMQKGRLAVTLSPYQQQSKDSASAASSSSNTLVFQEFAFAEGEWYHATIAHSPTSADSGSGSSSTPSSEPLVRFFVNGVKVAQGTLPYPRPSPSRLGVVLGGPEGTQSSSSTSSSTSSLSVFTDQDFASRSVFNWQLGNVYFMEDALSEVEVFLLYSLGPSYSGAVNLDLSGFAVPELITEKNLAAMKFPQRFEVLTHPGSFSLQKVQSSLFLIFSARNLVFAQVAETVPRTYMPLNGKWIGTVTSSQLQSHPQFRVPSLIYNMGGVSNIIYMLALHQTREHRQESLRLLQVLLKWQPRSIEEMDKIHGYELVAKLMRKNSWSMDEPLFEVIFSIVGLSKSRNGIYSTGVISNLEAFKHLLMDWRLWNAAPLRYQRLLFASIAELLSTHEYASFNVERLREINLIDALYDMMQRYEDSIPVQLAPLFITILEALMTDPPTDDNLKATFSYLISTSNVVKPAMSASEDLSSSAKSNPTSPPQTPSPRAPVNRVLFAEPAATSAAAALSSLTISSSTGAISSSASTASDVIRPSTPPSATASTSNLSNPGSTEPSPFSTPTKEFANNDLGAAARSLRLSVMWMLIDILSQNPDAANRFFNISTFEVLLALLKTPSIEERVAVLKLLDVILLQPQIGAKFKKLDGFFVLGRQLLFRPVTEEMFAVLFCIMMGKSAQRLREIRGRGGRQPIRPFFLGRLSEDVQLHHPSAVSAIVMQVANCVSAETSHFVMKTLHDLFLQNDKVKEQLLECGIVDSVCELFYPPVQQQLAQYGNEFEIELDSLQFLKTIVLHGTHHNTNPTGALYNIITALKAWVPSQNVCALHRKVLLDTLQFFLESTAQVNVVSARLLATGEQLSRLAFNTIAWHSTVAKELQRGDERLIALLPNTETVSCCLVDLITRLDFLTKGSLKDLVWTCMISLLTFTATSDEHIVAALSLLTSNITKYLKEQELITRVLSHSSHLLQHQKTAVRMGVWRIWEPIIRSRQPFLKKLFTMHESLREDQVLSRIGKQVTDSSAAVPQLQLEDLQNQISSADDRDTASRRQWLLELENATIARQANGQTRVSQSRIQQGIITNVMLTLSAQHTRPLLKRMEEMMQRERRLKQQWKILCKGVTHECAAWPREVELWKLDSTEGTHRMRIRLKPQTKTPHPFTSPAKSGLKSPLQSSVDRVSSDTLHKLTQWEAMIKDHTEPLLGSDSDLKNIMKTLALKPGEIQMVMPCSWITPFYKTFGEILIGDSCAYFIDDKPGVQRRHLRTDTKQIAWPYEEIKEVHKRRYLLRNTALEIFLLTGKTSLLAFETSQQRDSIYDKLLSMDLPNRENYEDETAGNLLRASMREKWQKGQVSNFEYLMHLNTLAGRTFNDLTQYPIFPWVLANYQSAELDLSNPTHFRDLSKPMGAQGQERLEKFVERFNQLIELNEKPYHYGSHYSNSGSVLHFLVRLEPFTRYFLEFQGGRFDVPDRSFHDLGNTWLLSSSISSSDVKELIPEFYCLPEFLLNSNRYELGVKQDGTRVNHVILPPWAAGSPRFFMKRHKEALESKIVSDSLHLWIDLIFGHKQQGEHARKACNVFYPLTYEGAVDIESIQDELMREATIAQISSYGQTPKQLFKKPHPPRYATVAHLNTIFAMSEKLIGQVLYSTSNEIGYLDMINDLPVALGPNRTPLYPEATKYISWGHWDQSLRVCAADSGKVLSLIETMHNDDVLCGHMTPNGRAFVTGGTACVVKVWAAVRNRKTKTITVKLQAVLHGHAKQVQCIRASQEWSLIVSGSQDRTCIIWDLNRLSYVRSLSNHSGAVVAVAISPTNGNIISVDESSQVRLWSINGDALAQTSYSETILCVIFSTGHEGSARNVVVGGTSGGSVLLWDAWDLASVRKLPDMHRNAVTALALSSDCMNLVSADRSGTLINWRAPG